jgi:hypothetical protein
MTLIAITTILQGYTSASLGCPTHHSFYSRDYLGSLVGPRRHTTGRLLLWSLLNGWWPALGVAKNSGLNG